MSRQQTQHVALIAMFMAVSTFVADLPGYLFAAQQSPQRELLELEQKRERCENVQAVLSALDLAKGKQVADIGASAGFYTMRIARVVGSKGRVFAVDISQRAIDALRKRADQEAATMVEPVLGTDDDPKLATMILDAALIVNSYHEMKKYPAILQHIRKALKPKGQLVIVELISPSNRGQTREVQETKHEIGSDFVEAELREAGFQIVERRDPFAYRDKSCGRVASYNTDVPDWWMIIARPKN